MRLEALEIRRLDRELEPLGAAATDRAQGARRLSSPTSRKTNGRAWRFASNSSSPRAEQDLDDVWRGVRATQAAIGPDQSHLRDTLSLTLTQIEKARAGRLAAATNSIPDVFWLVIVLRRRGEFHERPQCAQDVRDADERIAHVGGRDRHRADHDPDNPFRGETSVPAEMIADRIEAARLGRARLRRIAIAAQRPHLHEGKEDHRDGQGAARQEDLSKRSDEFGHTPAASSLRPFEAKPSRNASEPPKIIAPKMAATSPLPICRKKACWSPSPRRVPERHGMFWIVTGPSAHRAEADGDDEQQGFQRRKRKAAGRHKREWRRPAG